MIAKMATCYVSFFLLLGFLSIGSSLNFRQGRYKGGFIRPPKHDGKSALPPDQWFEQKLDHFNPQDLRTWQQVKKGE